MDKTHMAEEHPGRTPKYFLEPTNKLGECTCSYCGEEVSLVEALNYYFGKLDILIEREAL